MLRSWFKVPFLDISPKKLTDLSFLPQPKETFTPITSYSAFWLAALKDDLIQQYLSFRIQQLWSSIFVIAGCHFDKLQQQTTSFFHNIFEAKVSVLKRRELISSY